MNGMDDVLFDKGIPHGARVDPGKEPLSAVWANVVPRNVQLRDTSFIFVHYGTREVPDDCIGLFQICPMVDGCESVHPQARSVPWGKEVDEAFPERVPFGGLSMVIRGLALFTIGDTVDHVHRRLRIGGGFGRLRHLSPRYS